MGMIHTVNVAVPESHLTGDRSCLVLQRQIGMRSTAHHRIVVLSDSAERIAAAMEEVSPVVVDEIRTTVPKGKEEVFSKADSREIEAVMKKLHDPCGMNR